MHTQAHTQTHTHTNTHLLKHTHTNIDTHKPTLIHSQENQSHIYIQTLTYTLNAHILTQTQK